MPAQEGPWPFEPPPLKALRSSPRRVFAHYFTPFPVSLDNRDPEKDYYEVHYLSPDGEGGKHRAGGGYLRQRPLPRPPRPRRDWAELDLEEEVRRAAAIGLDGFAVDLLTTSGALWERTRLLMDAAVRVDPGFRILLMPDMEAELKKRPERMGEVLRELGRHPAALRMPDGRLVVSPFNAQNQDAAWWRNWIEEMKAAGMPVAFLPLFQGWERFAKDYAPLSAGFSDWGRRDPGGNRAWGAVPERARRHVPLWMMPVAPQDARPKDGVFWEAGNSENYRVMWENAILGKADWVHIITWNDYSESTEIAPSTGTQYAFYDLTAYYVAWFKTGRPPATRRDVLYYFHRVHPASAAPDPARQPRRMVLRGPGPPRDEIELLAVLAAPALLEIEIAGRVERKDAPAGMTSFKIPLAAGRPAFRALRGGRPVVSVKSAFEIVERIAVQDLMYRGGSSDRPPVAGVR